MNNISNSELVKKNISVQCSGMRHTQLFHGETSSLETSLAIQGSNTRQPNFNSSHLKAMNQFFKVPNCENIPVRKTNVKSILSPRRRVQTGRIKNDSKINQKMKMSFLPHPSLMNPRKTLMCSRTNNINSRKEVIKKMVLLAEWSQSENRVFKQSTPVVKLPACLTPRKTPRSQGYLLMPEFKKMGYKVDMGTPVQDIVSKKSTLSDLENDLNKDNKSNVSKVKLDLECFTPDKTAVFSQILQHCRTYNHEFNFVYGRLKTLEDSFESKIKNMPDYLVYDEFCHYESEKEKLYIEFKLVEEEFRNSVRNQTHVGKKLKEYLKQRGELFEKRTALHNKFETFVESLCEKSKPKTQEEERNDENRKNEKEKTKKNETPNLRRSIRLSKKNKHEEKTPLMKKLKRLDSKSKVIQKGKTRLG